MVINGTMYEKGNLIEEDKCYLCECGDKFVLIDNYGNKHFLRPGIEVNLLK